MTDRPTTELDGASHRRLGIDLFNRVWTLLELADRTPGQEDEMIHAAHASCHHWSLADERIPANAARGEWQCSRVYATLGRFEPALHHAERCLEILDDAGAAGRQDWDLAAAYEALARAWAVVGQIAKARVWAERARAELATIADPKDREPIERDLGTLLL